MVPVQAQSFVVVFHLVEAASVMMFALNLVIVAMMLNWFVHVSICECMHACMLIIIDFAFCAVLNNSTALPFQMQPSAPASSMYYVLKNL